MKRLQIVVAVVLPLLIAASAEAARSRPKARTLGHFDVSSAHHYQMTGPFRFQTQFANMRAFTSPNVIGSSNPTGQFSFLPRSADGPGGRIQITFVGIDADLHFACDVGTTGQVFEIDRSEHEDASGRDRSAKLSRTSSASGGGALLSFDTGPMFGKGLLVVSIRSDGASADWNLYGCRVDAK